MSSKENIISMALYWKDCTTAITYAMAEKSPLMALLKDLSLTTSLMELDATTVLIKITRISTMRANILTVLETGLV